MNDIPPEVRPLIRKHVTTMDHVEVLMRLHANPEATMAAGELQRLAHLDSETLGRCLRELIDAGLIRKAGPADSFQYAAHTDADRAAVDALSVLYHTRPVTLVKLIYERPPAPIQSFADAFRLRPDKGEQ